MPETICKRITRQTDSVFGLGAGITSADAELTGSRLPTCEQVLRCFFYHKQEGLASNRTNRDNAKLVLNQIKPFYAKGNIPMITEKKSCEKIIALAEKNAKLRKIPNERRTTTEAIAKVNAMKDELKQTFALWPKDAEKLIKNAEDQEFLQSMKTGRIATFGSHDKKLAQQLQRRQERVAKEKLRRLKAKEAMESSSSKIHQDSSEDSTAEEEEYVPPHSLHQSTSNQSKGKIRSGTSAFVPHDILRSPKIVSLCTRMKISPAQQAALTQSLIEESGGDNKKLSMSYSTADRARRNIGEQIAASVKDSWQPPKFLSLHWDSKLMNTLTNQDIPEERLTVAVSGSEEVKLLGVPAYQPGTNRKTGEIISQLTLELMRSWRLVDSIINMVFDTTASNTGHLSGACISLQEDIGRHLLWSGCRHHIGEVILTHVFNDLKVEASRGPDVSLFSRFKKQFDTIPHGETDEFSLFDASSFSPTAQILIASWKSEAEACVRAAVNHQRDDYKEFAELCLYFLCGAPTQYTFRRPGALHKARWMAKLLYAIKIVCLENQLSMLPPGTVTTKAQVPIS